MYAPNIGFYLPAKRPTKYMRIMSMGIELASFMLLFTILIDAPRVSDFNFVLMLVLIGSIVVLCGVKGKKRCGRAQRKSNF
jgi:hypothetical protein